MMTSLRNSPASRQARSSLVTVMRPLQGATGYWISLETKLRVKAHICSVCPGYTGYTGFTWWEDQQSLGWTCFSDLCSVDSTSVRKHTSVTFDL